MMSPTDSFVTVVQQRTESLWFGVVVPTPHRLFTPPKSQWRPRVEAVSSGERNLKNKVLIISLFQW